MGYYGITGWSGGGRRPINYGLKAGQFRTTKYNVFQNNTVINNNVFTGGGYGYYDNSCYGHCNSTPKWMNWMMGFGMVSSFLGGVMNMFGGGGQQVQGPQQQVAQQQPQQQPLQEQPQDTFKDKLTQAKNALTQLCCTEQDGYTVQIDPEGKITYTYTDPATGQTLTSPNLTDLIKGVTQLTDPQAKLVKEPEKETDPANLKKEEAPVGPAKGYENFTVGSYADCIDESERIQDIIGKFTQVEYNNGVPSKFTIVDKDSNTEYKFELTQDSSGNPVYKCVSKDNKAVIGNQYYVIENNKLVQKRGMEGFGLGIKTE